MDPQQLPFVRSNTINFSNSTATRIEKTKIQFYSNSLLTFTMVPQSICLEGFPEESTRMREAGTGVTSFDEMVKYFSSLSISGVRSAGTKMVAIAHAKRADKTKEYTTNLAILAEGER